jgi:hypothetical protein
MPNNTVTKQRIFNKVVFHLKNETKFFTSNDLATMIGVDVWKKLAEDIEYPIGYISSIVSVGAHSLSTPSDFIKCKQHKENTLRKPDPSITVASGVPDNYWLDNTGQIGWYPPATGTQTVVIPYVKEPTSLSGDSSTNELTERGFNAAVYWVVSECMLRDNDARYTSFLSLYQNEVARLNGILGGMCGVPGLLQVHEAPERRRP